MTFLNARLARGGLAAALLTGTSVLAVSCVGLLELDGYAGAVSDLCAKLRECFGDEYFPECEAHGEPRILGASAEQREAWLQSFADRHCLESCANARACLDMPPVCGALDEQCAQKEQCCGFLTGASECGTGQCCSGRGQLCSAAGDCCDPALGCELDVGENEVVCGGVACVDANEPCQTSDQCCSGTCDTVMGICTDEICLPEGSRCGSNLDCCDLFCDRALGDGNGGICAPPPCLPDGELCDDMSEIQCCSQFCIGNPNNGDSVCSSGQCLPDNTTCEQDFDCCSNFCDPMFKLCLPTCGGGGAPCEVGCCPNAECGPDQLCCLVDFAPCLTSEECCGQKCTEFLCASDTMCGPPGDPCNDPTECCTGACDATSQVCCDVTNCHDECVMGGPLSPVCQNDSSSISCVTSICSQMPECCCSAWTQDCVDAVLNICGDVCPVITVEVEGTIPN